MATTLLDYLTQPNPGRDDTHALKGVPTDWDEEIREDLTTTEWRDFTYENLMNTFGDVLMAGLSRPMPKISPPLKPLELEIYDEDSLDHLLTRSTMAEVSEALLTAWQKCYPNSDRPIDITRGGRARRPENNTSTPRTSREPTPAMQGQSESERKLFPDWAGVRKAHNLPTYVNRCPGDTKLSGKWTSMGDRTKKFYWWPIAQVLGYCDTWRVRYGYLITQEELVVFRFSADPIGPGLASTRSPRLRATAPSLPLELSSSPPQLGSAFGSPHRPSPALSPSARHQARQRTASVTSITSHMSIDQVSLRSTGQQSQQSESNIRAGSDYMVSQSQMVSRAPSLSESIEAMAISSDPYYDDGRGHHWLAVEMKSISWGQYGRGRLTVKLALWWLHMLAAGPTESVRISKDYQPLNEWESVNGGHRHTTTGRFIRGDAPRGSVILRRDSPPGSRAGRGNTPQTPPRQTGQRAGGRQQFGSPHSESSPLSNILESPPESTEYVIYLEDLREITFDNRSGGWQYKTRRGSQGHLSRTQGVYSRNAGRWYRAQLDAEGRVQWVRAQTSDQSRRG